MKPFNKYFDHTLLKADATREQILRICREAAEYDFASVCVNSCHVKMCADALASTDVKVATVVGFPLGAMSTQGKLVETEVALKDGAKEVDMVINIGYLKEGDATPIIREIKILADACHHADAILKVIIETCLLTDEEKKLACTLVTEAGADFIKTSTGFSTGGATAEDVQLMAKNTGAGVQVKASGGIRTLDDALAMIEAGADRLGCSASVGIMKEYAARG